MTQCVAKNDKSCKIWKNIGGSVLEFQLVIHFKWNVNVLISAAALPGFLGKIFL